MRDPATFELQDRDGIPVVVVAGEIDISNIDRLNALFEEALTRDQRAVVLSLEAVSYLDSTSFTALGKWSKRTHIFVISPKSESVQRLFAIVGLERVVRLLGSLDAAVEAAKADAMESQQDPV